MNLKERAQAFLDRKPPDEIAFVPGSIAELFIHNYALGKAFDAEMLELGELALMASDEAVETHSTKEAQEYFTECKTILSEIIAKVGTA